MRVAACFHGFLRTGASMWWVARRLRAMGYAEVILPTFGYHLRPLGDNVEAAALLVEKMRARHPEARLDVVTHSYGGILARAVFARDGVIPPHRVLMFSPPNRGAVTARKVRATLPVHHTGWDPLGPMLPGVPEGLPLPRAQVGVLTGGLGHARGFNPLLGADNDGTVRVDEAYIDGLTAFEVVPILHALMPIAPRTLDGMERFLNSGRF